MPQEIIGKVAGRSIVLAQVFATAVAQGTMNSEIEITRPGSDDFDEDAREFSHTDPTEIYSGVAGITPAAGSVEMSLGDEPTYYSSITAQIPNGSTRPRIDDVIKIITSPDTDVEGWMFRITDVPSGGRIIASITLHASGIAPSKQWST